MSKEKKEVHQVRMTDGKRKIIAQLLEEYDIKDVHDIQEALKDLLGGTIEEMLECEMNNYLTYPKYARSSSENTRNGYKQKEIKSSLGTMKINLPQDRQSTFDPKIVEKRKKDISEIEHKIISMYAKGMTTSQISNIINDIYGFEPSESLISDITDKILPMVEEWQNRPLDEIYPILFIDATHYSVKIEGIIKKVAAYVILGVNLEGKKDVLSIEIGENESAKYWLSVLNGLKNRGLKDVFVLCSDGLTGIKEAVASAFPKTELQTCIVHLIRNTLKYVAEKDRKEFAKDLKGIYTATTEKIASEKLANVESKWEAKYPYAMKSWITKWENISPIFKFSSEVRKVIYTTNAIESLNATYRKLNRQRSVFPNETALLKALYLSTQEATKKWTMPLRNWGKILNEFSIMYEERMPNNL